MSFLFCVLQYTCALFYARDAADSLALIHHFAGKYSSGTGYQSDTSCITCPPGYSCEGGKDKVQCPSATATGWSYCPGDICASIGCDGVPNSGRMFDVCGVCGGGGIAAGTCNCAGDVLDECGVCTKVLMCEEKRTHLASRIYV